MSKNTLQKYMKTEVSHKNQESIRAIRSDSLYNLKDFLPSSSGTEGQTRNKIKSTIHQKTQANLVTNKSSFLNINSVDQRVFQHKINKLKDQNFNLQKTLNEKEQINKMQATQIEELKKQIQRLNNQKLHKVQNLRLWSYKYHLDYIPKQSKNSIYEEHKYELAVQTQDSYGKNQSSLKARDFQDIYRRLNSNPSTVQLGGGANKQRKQMTNTSNISIPSFLNLNNNQSIINRNSTVKFSKKNDQKLSLFKIPRMQEMFPHNQEKQNNIMNANFSYNPSSNFSKNPMEINFAKIQAQQKPPTQQSLQIYPVSEQYLDSIVGQILCGDSSQ